MLEVEILNVICAYAPQVGIVNDMSELRHMHMMGRVEISVMGKEIVEGCQFWTLQLPMI